MDNSLTWDQPLIGDRVNCGVSNAIVRVRCMVAIGTISVTAQTPDYVMPAGIMAIEG